MSIDLKTCSTCKVPKLFTDFARDSTRTDGYDHNCKECRHKRVERIKTRHYRRKYRERNPLKESARTVVHRLVKSGKLIKEDCFLCGVPETAAHHLNYEFSDKIVWLCRKHHDEVHNEI